VAQVVVGKHNVSYRKAHPNPLLNLEQLLRNARRALKSRIARRLALSAFRNRRRRIAFPRFIKAHERDI